MKKSILRKLAIAMSTALAIVGTFGIAAIADDGWHSDDSVEIYAGGDSSSGSYGYMSPSTSSVEVQVGGTNGVSVNVYGCSGAIDVYWVSYDESVARVSGAGNSCTIYGVNQGSCQIAAQLYVNGQQTDVDTFNVNVGYFDHTPQGGYVGVSGINAGNRTSFQLEVGKYVNCGASVTPSNANNKRIRFSSNNINVARVDDDGCIYAVSPGTCAITATTEENGYQVHYAVTVVNTNTGYVPVQGISLNPGTATIGVGQSFSIEPSIFPVTATNKNGYWSSTNPNIASVDNNGKVVGIQPGSVMISCTTQDGNKVAYCQVNIVANSTTVVKAVNTRDPQLNYAVVQQIINAAPNAVVTVPAIQAMSYDKCVATALAGRKDVILVCTFPYADGMYSLALPAGYDLASQLDATGYVEWTQLATRTGVSLAKIH